MMDTGQSLTVSRLSPISWAGSKLFGSLSIAHKPGYSLYFKVLLFNTILTSKLAVDQILLVNSIFVYLQKIFYNLIIVIVFCDHLHKKPVLVVSYK